MELQIGQVAKRFGISANAIRHYEERGLIGPLQRKEAGYASRGYRIFTKRDMARLEFIRQARLLDVSLKEINQLLESVDQGCCSSARPNLRQVLEAKLREIGEKMEGIKRFRRQLKRQHQKVASEPASICPPGASPSQCVFGNCQEADYPARR